ncbi:MAG TPA: dienelactone hydrolase family protein [Acidimicrobiia bacterium]|nr:dienelactone hydrolase family protein [Acidimicrobiia bacterium]
MEIRDIEYEVGDTTMIGRLAVPDGDGRRPGVLIAHEGNGLDDFQKERAEHFAALGYVAFALDYHGGGVPLTERAAISARITELAEDAMLARATAQAGLDILLADEHTDAARVAAVGYCFGGALVLELGRSGADLKAIVGFHPGLMTSRPQDSARIRGSVLVCIGADDPLIGIDARTAFEAEMRAAGIDWRMYVFGGAQHSFTHPRSANTGLPGLAYHRPTDERSWRAMRDLFAETIDA